MNKRTELLLTIFLVSIPLIGILKILMKGEIVVVLLMVGLFCAMAYGGKNMKNSSARIPRAYKKRK